jgi:uncharacterized membrane protein YhaH (DUF805 family)
MSFGESIATCFGKYADFNGRASRPEYWWFFLFNILVVFGAAAAGAAIRVPGIMIVPLLGLLIPHLAVTVRRLHDTDKSGAWWFISLVPYIGGIVLIVLLAMAGTPGVNTYGLPPSPGLAVQATRRDLPPIPPPRP